MFRHIPRLDDINAQPLKPRIRTIDNPRHRMKSLKMNKKKQPLVCNSKTLYLNSRRLFNYFFLT